ncbi:MAG: YggT family protein [Candidatus Dojkabacteria bacterium]|nr:YggT family protein [Candidatus Dojkabacteria bacterium]
MLRLILRILYTIDIMIETVIILKILISIFASNSTHVFVEWVNTISSAVITPFEGIAPSVLVIDNIEIAITPVIALLIYAIAGFVLSELIKAFKND